jgi:DNA-binding response OmpR family regulator
MNLQVLLVEDTMDLAVTIIQYLELEGIQCDHAANGQAGLSLATKNAYDVLLLDINLPRMDGLSVCESLRRAGKDIPVLMLTARATLADKMAGFDAGTDDYLVKPFELQELVMRVQALSRRRSEQVKKLQVADLVLDLEQREATRAGEVLQLTPTGWLILEALMRKSPKVISRQALEQALWNDEPPDSNTLKVHLHKLRQQVDKPFSKPLIQTVPGHGFVLKGVVDD